MDVVSEVKTRLNIEDVIGEYISLKRAGRNWKGLSPFTNEKTPSLIVSPEKQIWKDFSSGKGGSVIDFIMESEGLDFKEALELLARKAGIDIEQITPKAKSSGPSKERLYSLLEASTKFYQVQLTKNKAVLDYVIKQRKFTRETILSWRLGYSPNTGQALQHYLKKLGYSEPEIKAAGLSSANYRQTSDMFRQRLMVPLADPQGRIVGFTARLIGDSVEAPKYINTPQTALYDKSQQVFGLNLAKESIRKTNFAVITEGNLDVIMSHQAGVKEVVATAGTALTLQQLKIISRFTNDLRLAFDSDRAGLAATERVIPIASKARVSLSIVEIPGSKDPDELIKQDPNAWKETVKKPIYALDWLMNRYKSLLDMSSAKGKKEYSDVLLPIIRSLEDPVEVDHYMNLISKELDISKSALEAKLIKNHEATEVRKKPLHIKNVEIDKGREEYIKIQDKFLSLMLMRPTLREFLGTNFSEDIILTDPAKQLMIYLKDNLKVSLKDMRVVKNIEDYVKIEALLYEELYQGLELNELHEEATRLQADLITKFVKLEKEKLREILHRTTKDVDIRLLQERDRHLNQLLRDIKGEVNA